MLEPSEIEALVLSTEKDLTATTAGQIRRRFVGRARHRGVIRLTLISCRRIDPQGVGTLRYMMTLEDAEYQVRSVYGIAWWVLPLMQIILAVINWWIENRSIENG
jgi:hypothetical protein